MRKWLILIVLLFPAATAFANPVIIFDPIDGVRYVIVLGSILGLEVLVTTIILFFCHIAVVPSLIALFTGNLLMYFVIFKPILSATENVPVAEAVIVAAEGVFIKVISLFDTFRLEDFKGLKWRTAFIISAVGNILSYGAGSVISG
jgi:hypothetical protein